MAPTLVRVTTRVALGTKAETLQQLAPLITGARVLPMHRVSYDDWCGREEGCLDAICEALGGTATLIVRSSARIEGAKGAALSGAYKSLLGVRGREALAAAVDAVFASYGLPSADDEVLVQPQMRSARASGVATSIDPGSGAPYRVISWATGPDTTLVTAGRSDTVRTWYCVTSTADPVPPDSHLESVLTLIDEVSRLVEDEAFVIEYAVDSDDELVLFQVTPLVSAATNVSVDGHAEVLESIASRLGKTENGAPLYGVMPDWNPAEIIGLRPRPLALSLYRYLVTDDVWARARVAYGYGSMVNRPLMTDFAGLPYIDVPASFESFVPAGIDEALASRIVSYYRDRLVAEPALHDKIEFRIVLSCLTPSTSTRLAELRKAGFTGDECAALTEALGDVTNNALDQFGRLRDDLAAIDRLEALRFENDASFSGAMAMLAACRELGALPFAGLARGAFICTELLNSLVERRVLAPAEAEAFFASVETVTSGMLREFESLPRDAFLARYGHLRPSTYDITSSRYDEAPDAYFGWERSRSTRVPENAAFVPGNLESIDKVLRETGLRIGAAALFERARSFIQAREQAKFVFTRVLSDALRQINQAGANLGLTPDDLSFLDLRALRAAGSSPDREQLAAVIARNREAYDVTKSVMLPALILHPGDVWSFEQMAAVPTFVGHGRVDGRVADLAAGDDPDDAIVLVESADPGYDWIFTRGIRGLVTAFGGANSHMAVRAHELGLSAALGVGTARFEALRQARQVEIDCAAGRLTALS